MTMPPAPGYGTPPPGFGVPSGPPAAMPPQPPRPVWYRLVSVVVLVVFNAIPLAGVLWFGWDLFTILILYWLESGVIGLVNVLKIARAEGVPAGGDPRVRIAGRPVGTEARGCLALFFLFHYGIFWVVHGVFVLVMPLLAGLGPLTSGGSRGPAAVGMSRETFVLTLVGLVAFHLLAYWWDFVGRGEYRRTSPAAQMFRPYARVFVLHITILAGAFVVLTTGEPVVLVALLVALKTIIDLGLYAVGTYGGRRQPSAGAV